MENGVGGTKSEAVNSLATRTQIQDPNDQVAQEWAFFQHQKALNRNIGTTVAPHYKPHELLSRPPWPKDITLELLMASQSHLGHATSLWHPANAKYIFGIRGIEDPIHIISLDVTAAHLRRACKIVRGVTERGGLILFVGSREGQARAVVKAAEMAQGCHLFTKWIPGSITNGQQILGKCRKKVVNELDAEVAGFEEQLISKAAIKPDLVVCLNPLENYVLLHECGLNNIPTVGIIDTDVNPTWVTYPIPANDDSLRCVQLIAGALGRAGQEGQEARLAKAKRGVVEYRFAHGLQPPAKEEPSSSKAQRRKQQQITIADYTENDDSEATDVFSASAEELQSEDDSAMLPADKIDPSLTGGAPLAAEQSSTDSYDTAPAQTTQKQHTLPESAGDFTYDPSTPAELAQNHSTQDSARESQHTLPESAGDFEYNPATPAEQARDATNQGRKDE